PEHDHDVVCGPAKPDMLREVLGTIRASRLDPKRTLYATGDEVMIDGGILNGLRIGRNVVARRLYRVNQAAGGAAAGERTAGLLQIVEADDRSATAVVVYACDELMTGDYLASFDPNPGLEADAEIPMAARQERARIVFGDVGEWIGVPGRLLVIDHGSAQGM